MASVLSGSALLYRNSFRVATIQGHDR